MILKQLDILMQQGAKREALHKRIKERLQHAEFMKHTLKCRACAERLQQHLHEVSAKEAGEKATSFLSGLMTKTLH